MEKRNPGAERHEDCRHLSLLDAILVTEAVLMPGSARSCRRTADVQLSHLVGRPEREHGDAPFRLYQREPEGGVAVFVEQLMVEARPEFFVLFQVSNQIVVNV